MKLLQTRARVAASFWHAPKPGELAKLRAQGLEVAEVRLDLAGITTPEDAAALMKHFAQLPSIATMRSAEEGGKWRGGAKARHDILKAALQYADAADVEIAASNADAIAKTARAMGKTIILSRHNFGGVDAPETMDETAKKILLPNGKAAGGGNKKGGGENKAAGGENKKGGGENKAAGGERKAGVILKIAGRVKSASDLRVMEDFLRRWRRYPVVVIGMGESQNAITSRRAFPRQGSKLAFAAITKKSAPGQLSLPQTKTACRK